MSRRIPTPPPCPPDQAGSWIFLAGAVWVVAWAFEPQAATVIPRAVVSALSALCNSLHQVMPILPWACAAIALWAVGGILQPAPSTPRKTRRAS